MALRKASNSADFIAAVCERKRGIVVVDYLIVKRIAIAVLVNGNNVPVLRTRCFTAEDDGYIEFHRKYLRKTLYPKQRLRGE